MNKSGVYKRLTLILLNYSNLDLIIITIHLGEINAIFRLLRVFSIPSSGETLAR